MSSEPRPSAKAPPLGPAALWYVDCGRCVLDQPRDPLPASSDDCRAPLLNAAEALLPLRSPPPPQALPKPLAIPPRPSPPREAPNRLMVYNYQTNLLTSTYSLYIVSSLCTTLISSARRRSRRRCLRGRRREQRLGAFICLVYYTILLYTIYYITLH